VIAFPCPHCNKPFNIMEGMASERIKCPYCAAFFFVPDKITDLFPSASAPPAQEISPTVSMADDKLPETSSTFGTASPPTSLPRKSVPASWPGSAYEKTIASGQPFPPELTAFLAPPLAADEIGRLGPYRVLSILGHGGMGVVFRAEDPALKRAVALKAMQPALSANHDHRARFLREAQTAAAVKDDHVVSIYQVGEDRGVAFLAMEFLEGEPLDQRLKRGPELTMAEILRIGRETALGLAAAHKRGLVHRDIKPANLWLENKNESGKKKDETRNKKVDSSLPSSSFRVKILDFGVARPLTEQTHVTQSGAVIGTPTYMAPEQAAGEKVDHRCDLFSLGCVLFLLTTGQVPFRGTNAIAVLRAMEMTKPPPPHVLNPAVPKGLSDLVMQLLAKKPEERPATAQAVADTLAQEPLTTVQPDRGSRRPLSGPYQRSRTSRRSWPMLAEVLAVLLIIGLGVVGLVLCLKPPTGQKEQDKKQSSFQATSFQLYFGREPDVLEQLSGHMKKGHVAVIETRALVKTELAGLLHSADTAGAKVLGYLSLGELHDNDVERFRQFLKAYLAGVVEEKPRFASLEAITIGRDETFKARRVDVLADSWRAFIFAEIDRIYATGVAGLFLDTIDTVDLYIGNKDWSLARRCESVEAMMALVRGIKERDRSKFILQNRGLNLIGANVFIGDETGKMIPGLNLTRAQANNPDGVLWENAFAGQDDWSLAKEKELRSIQEGGKATIFTLGYKSVWKTPDAFFRRCTEAGFVPAWAESSQNLHLGATLTPDMN
jgi:serine/threonine protein kinase/endo-alpha-1,4-polygalactosaminidase (GH114 family)